MGALACFLIFVSLSFFIYKIRLLSLIFPVFQVSCRGAPLPWRLSLYSHRSRRLKLQLIWALAESLFILWNTRGQGAWRSHLAWRSCSYLEHPTCLCVSPDSLSWDRLSVPTKFWWEMMLSACFSQDIAEMVKPFSSSLELAPQQWVSYNSHGSHSPLLFWWWLFVCRTMAQGAGPFDYSFSLLM